MNESGGMINGSEEGNEEAETALQMGLHEHDLSGGGEFLGDGLRMNEQVFQAKATPGRKTRYHL